MQSAIARSGINVALVKYWGKREAARNLPAVGSLALTLEAPGTETQVTFDPLLAEDRFALNGVEREDARVVALLDQVRALAGFHSKARVESHNTVLTASGLASSASGFAALGVASWCAAGLPWDPLSPDPRLVDVVRCGSGSAPRSLLGGLVELSRETGQIHQLLAPENCDLRLAIAVLSKQPKAMSSRQGMAHTAATSPYFEPFVTFHEGDLKQARQAIQSKDFAMLGEAMERSTWRMHAAMIASDPPLRYLASGSLRVIEAVEALRAQGVSAYFTADAGPQVKTLCQTCDQARVDEALRALPEVLELQWAKPGSGCQVRMV